MRRDKSNQVRVLLDTGEDGGPLAVHRNHEKRDEARGIGLGPEHDWSSHAADAFGLMCVAYEAPRPERRVQRNAAQGGWMS
jgi:phage terminase large subunit